MDHGMMFFEFFNKKVILKLHLNITNNITKNSNINYYKSIKKFGKDTKSNN